MRSLRARVLLGAVLWTAGLLSATTIAITLHPRLADTIRIVHSHGRLMGWIAAGCMIAGLAVVRAAFVPLNEMRRRLSDVRNGSAHHLRGRYPAEVQPLVDDLNGLLSHSEQMVSRAVAKAGDLAHGLKTPLAILSNEADRLTAHGDADLAKILAEQVALMRRQIDYHLAHARAAASGTAGHAQCPAGDSVDGLIRTLRQLHAHRALDISSRIDPRHLFKGRREDLDEMLGNLLDNACKWARARVVVASSLLSGRLVLTVEDDGAGLDPDARQLVLQRGVRRDEVVPGSGLGLAIVRDVADLYGGSISLEQGSMGGLAAILELPGAESSTDQPAESGV